MKKLLYLLTLSIFLSILNSNADEIWPWSIQFNVQTNNGIVENEASMWIGDENKPVRGIILTSMVRNEVDFNYDEQIRNTAKEMGLALVFFYGERNNDFYTGGGMSVFDITKRHDTTLLGVLKDFAALSGKPEIEHAPWMAFGHSTAGLFTRHLAWWKPERMFGIIHYKTGGYGPPEWVESPDTNQFKNVPWLSVAARNDKYGPGEQGWKNMRKDMMPWRKTGCLMSELVEPTMEEGHSVWRPFNAPYFSMWIKKAVENKIPADSIATEQPIQLLEIDNRTGVLTDTTLEFLMDSARIRDDLVRFYYDVDPEERGNMFWHFDDEIALAWVNYEHVNHGEYTPQQDTLVTGEILSWNSKLPLGYPDNDMFNETTEITGYDGNGEILENILQKNSVISIKNYQRDIKISRDIPGDFQNTNEAISVLPVINGMDVFFMEKIVNDDNQFKPQIYQIWSADVNMDGKINQDDLSQLIDRALYKIPEFKQTWNYDTDSTLANPQPSIDWVFYEQSRTRVNPPTAISKTYPQDDGIGYSKNRFPGISNMVTPKYQPGNPYWQFQESEFYGMMLGDVDGSYGIPAEQDENIKILLDFNSLDTLENDNLKIPIIADNDFSIYAVDLSIELDSANFESIDFVKEQNIELYHHVEDSIASMISWAPVGGVKAGSTLAWLICAPGELNNLYHSRANGLINGAICKVEKSDILSSVQNKKYGLEINVYPVPTKDKLFININSPEHNEMCIELFDVSGKLILTNQYNNVSNSTCIIDMSSFNPGVYFLYVNQNKNIIQKKILKMH